MENNKKLVINPKWCKGCGICVEFCPKKALELKHEKVRIADEEACILYVVRTMRYILRRRKNNG